MQFHFPSDSMFSEPLHIEDSLSNYSDEDYDDKLSHNP